MRKKVKQKQYIVIGMGRFGTSVALTLAELGREVLAIDKDVDRIQDISDKVTHAVTLDSTDENDLKAVGIGNFDVAIVAIGKDIQASIMTTLLLKELGVKDIYLSFDKEEGIKWEQKLDKICKRIYDFGFNVFIIEDVEGKYLDLKDSPIDHGKEVFEILLQGARKYE